MKYDQEVIYQIYPLTFKDSNHDGVGDLLGVKSKLDYLQSLGVSYLWLSPIMLSPMHDNGYDISDYYQVNPCFGNNEEYLDLIKAASKHKIKVMMDLVMNHTSDEHEWFIKSKARIKPYDEYYVWRKKPVPGFSSQFENSCWTYVEERDEYYLHQFSKHQPDLNWENPAILQEFRTIIKYWISKGIKGFRFDVVDMIGKQIDRGIKIDVDRSFALLKELGRGLFTNNKLLTVGECWSTGRQQAAKYTSGKNPVLSMVFNARYMFIHENGSRWKQKALTSESLVEYRDWIFNQNRILVDSHIPNFVENHDFPRVVSRLWSDEANIFAKSKLIFTIHYLKRGSSFIYQGQELGLPNPKYKEVFDIDDIESQLAAIKEEPEDIFFGTRDNARKPMPWSNHEQNRIIPFYQYPEEFLVPNQLIDKESPLHYWKLILNLKEQYRQLFATGKYELIMKDVPGTFAYTISNEKQRLIVVTSWFDQIAFDSSHYRELFSQNYHHAKLDALGIFIGIKKLI